MPPRSATKVTLSHEAYVLQLHEKTLQLERDVESAAKRQQPGGVDEASRIRLPLCEAMTNLILLDPAFSAQKDVAGRLWRSCFYTRIGPQRAKWEKAKRRGLDTSRLQESLSNFLAESVVLYEYLITNLRHKLMKKFGMPLLLAEEEDTASTQEYSQVSASVASPPPPGLSTDGIVSLLMTCYISLGDLWRYDSVLTGSAASLDKAEKAYRTAAILAPGFGHAYNQLAVVCQTKDKQGSPLSAVAFYWYTRALLVTQDPFNVAKSNLARLLASNHEWVVKQEAEANDRSKSAQTRRFLAIFVDLQFRFFQGIEESAMTSLWEQKETVMNRLKALLEMSAFGDALLCRLVVIHAFSECFLDRPNGSPSNLTMNMARVATYEFGSCLVDRVLAALSKVSERQLPSSVRLLLPVLLVAEYTAQVSMPPVADNALATQALENASRTFWQGLIAIWNKVSQLAPSDFLETTPNEELTGFAELRGFGPFTFLPPCHDGLLSDGECLQELIRVNETTNETASTSTGSGIGGGTDQGRLKFARLLRLGHKLTEDKDGTIGRYIHKDADGNFVWLDNAQEEQEPIDTDDDPMELDGNDENMLVYKTGPDGGPALLVPGMLLQEGNTEDVAAPMATPTKRPMTPDNQDQSVASERLPVFNATPVTLRNTDTPLAIPHPLTEPPMGNAAASPGFGLATAGLHMPPGLNSTVGMLQPPPGFASPAPPPSTRQAETIGEALRLYGDQLQTANPFVDPPAGLSHDFMYSAPSSLFNFFGGGGSNNDDPMSVEGASLLDSGLLNSLWMDDGKSKSKNPFAT